jgi:hypothetical protein
VLLKTLVPLQITFSGKKFRSKHQVKGRKGLNWLRKILILLQFACWINKAHQMLVGVLDG